MLMFKSMIKQIWDRTEQFSIWCCFLLLTGLVIGGCQFHSAQPVGVVHGPADQARQSFLDGDYQLAREKFTTLAEQTSDLKFQKAGFYGLGCIDMVLAGDVDTFFKRLESLLHQFDKADRFYLNNAELLFRALAHGSRLMNKEQEQILVQMTGLKADKIKLNMEIQKLQQQIKTLQHQISSLESIDQDLQEKRKNQ